LAHPGKNAFGHHLEKSIIPPHLAKIFPTPMLLCV